MVIVSPDRMVRSIVATFADEVAMHPAVAPSRMWTKMPEPRYGVRLSGARLKFTTIE
jgi:hypothetical protein